MSMRRQVARAIGKAIDDRIKLPEPTAIISAPPSEVSDVPRTALWLEKFTREWHHQEEPEVDANGEILIGGRATLAQGVGAAMIQQGVQLTILGTLRGSGRLWVGCRLPAKREEIEDNISFLFADDPAAPGRLLVTVEQPRVGSFVLPWGWTGAAFIGDTDWEDEFAFSERLWSWVKVDVDIQILVPRFDPMIEQFIVTFDQDYTIPVDAVEEASVVVADTSIKNFSWTAPSDGVLGADGYASTVALPGSAMPDATYVVAGFELREAAPGDGVHPDARFPTSGRLSNSFTVVTDAPIRAGSVYDVLIRDRT